MRIVVVCHPNWAEYADRKAAEIYGAKQDVLILCARTEEGQQRAAFFGGLVKADMMLRCDHDGLHKIERKDSREPATR